MTIPIYPNTPNLQPTAAQLAAVFHLPLSDHPNPTGLTLHLRADYLELIDFNSKENGIYVDFIGGRVGYRRQQGGGKNQPLGRAIGLKKNATPRIIDATAGLGRDAFVLACLGCRITLVERSPVVAALLHDGLQRAQQDPETAEIITRIKLIHQDASDYLAHLPPDEKPDVIYLDPMYPHRDKSALVKKEMRIFRQLVGEDLDADKLLPLACGNAKQRVVVKRPRLAPFLAETKPTVSIESPNTRFDVYISNVL
ncbi:N6-adenine-specific methylase [Beggiatoa alba B18LD]|uniref:Ribosomal RNA small subunit methyltransferase J n=1 Tax=Beggiatoa alba B18LD TaxID=395493 RepID=I3CKD2_9GAMM|nr:class I SAM-dependent methyltransferase [Beggiatoa alba]EIJ44075.1 N6-adenine-specific methylase [Beggiatoa alba B18LD]